MQLLSAEEIERLRGTFHKEQSIRSNLFEFVVPLKIGKPADAAYGLENRMCVENGFPSAVYFERIAKGVKGIQDEVYGLDRQHDAYGDTTTEVREVLDYILFEAASEKEYPCGVRDKGRGPMTLSDFMEKEEAKESGLTEAELVAMRLYTSSAFRLINTPMRDDERFYQGKSCPLAVTTYFAARGIKKLRARHALDSNALALWRGMRCMYADDDFMRFGGTELAFMSTTNDLRVAASYSASKQSLLLKIVSSSFMMMGADLQWLSIFPDGVDIVYPPLTYLRPTGRTQVSWQGCELRFHLHRLFSPFSVTIK